MDMGAKFLELRVSPSNSNKFCVPLPSALFDKRLKNHSPGGFEMVLTSAIADFVASACF
jgi:hypothetical protein